MNHFIKAYSTNSDVQEIIHDDETNTGSTWSSEKINDTLNGALAEVNHDLNYRISVFKITANYDPTNLDSLREVILSNINLASGYTRTCIFEITNLGNQMSAVWVSVVSSAYFSCIVNSYYFTNAFLRYSGGSWIN